MQNLITISYITLLVIMLVLTGRHFNWASRIAFSFNVLVDRVMDHTRYGYTYRLKKYDSTHPVLDMLHKDEYIVSVNQSLYRDQIYTCVTAEKFTLSSGRVIELEY